MVNQSNHPFHPQQETEPQAKIASSNSTEATRVLVEGSTVESLVVAQAAALKLISKNAALLQILEQTARIIDQNIPCAVTSICLFDAAKRHLNAIIANAAAELTRSYDGLTVLSPNSPFASAVLEKKPVIITDFAMDNRWPDSQRLAVKCGFHACWIFPVVGDEDAVLGLLILHSRQSRSLGSGDKAIIDIAVDLTRLSIEYKNARERHSASNIECNERLQQRTAELESANRALETFCHSVCHELKGPLRSMNGFAEAIIEEADGRLSPDCIEMINRLQNSVRQMTGLVENLLTFACTSQQPVNKTSVNMAQLVRTLIAEHRHQIQSSAFTIQYGSLPDCPGDPHLLRLVWENLISNALKYTARSPHPKIEIGSTQEAHRTIYWIRDNGVGFDQNEAARLFHPFQRLHSLSEYDGTGVGLAIVDNIVRRHGGSVRAESQTGAGAAFYFTLLH